jgi:hypothetical protein
MGSNEIRHLKKHYEKFMCWLSQLTLFNKNKQELHKNGHNNTGLTSPYEDIE